MNHRVLGNIRTTIVCIQNPRVLEPINPKIVCRKEDEGIMGLILSGFWAQISLTQYQF